jgi:hypothetical protein
MRTSLRVAVVLVMCGALAGAAIAAAQRAPGPAVVFPVVTADPAHRIEAPRTAAATLRGQVVVLAFLDDGCDGCDVTAQTLKRLSPAGGVARLGVATGIDATRAVALGARAGIPMAVDAGGAIAAAYGVTALPTVVVLDRQGGVAARFDVPPDAARLAAALAPLRAEPIPADVAPVATRPVLSVFDRPAVPLGRLPAALRTQLRPATTLCPYLPGSLRLAAEGIGQRRLYVARGFDGGIVTATSDPVTRGAGVSCGVPGDRRLRGLQLREMRARGVVSIETTRAKGRPTVYSLVVLDGYDTAKYAGLTYDVGDNGLVFEGFPGRTTVTLSGPKGVKTVRLDRP